MKQSRAKKITAEAVQRAARLVLTVTDDAGGRGSGPAGLAQRIRTVDGELEISSPPGGPTLVRVDLPLRA